MSRRSPMSRSSSRRSFTKGAVRTKSINVGTTFRGGIRL